MLCKKCDIEARLYQVKVSDSLICSAISRWLIPQEYSARIFSSIPSAFRLYFPMIFGSKLPFRSRGIHVNDKRVLRICRVKDIKSTIKYANQGCTRRAKNPQYVAENLLDRQFHADKPNEKWLTDVTEFKWYEGAAVHKIYLSAILDLYDRRIVAAVVGDSNDNPLVFKTFDKAVKANPDAHPLFHSDRGFQYTSRDFHRKLEQAGMTQSMSRIAHCIDNGPMEGFWGILKRERYYGKRFTSKQELTQMIVNYIRYYNTRRVQRSLGILTPVEKHELYLAA